MSSVESVVRAIEAHPNVHQAGNSVAVVTDCLYPSNGAVTVYVTGGERECLVSDNGETARIVKAHGVHVPNEKRWLGGFCKRFGLKEEHGRIYSPPVPLQSVTGAIALVANAAAMAARYALDEYKEENEAGVLETIYAQLIVLYGKPHVFRDVDLAGSSTRTYSFDFHISVPRGPQIVADYVVPFSASINAKAAAHTDIGRLDRPPFGAIVYDAAADWQASELSFLQQAAQLVPYQKLKEGFLIFTQH
jgi:hypothetical protein